MKIIPFVLSLLFFLSGCGESGLEESELEDTGTLLLGRWQLADHTSLIQFDRDQKYTLEIYPGSTFQLSYYLDTLNQLVIHDSTITRTYAVKFLSSEELQLTDLDLPHYYDMAQRISIFRRAE